MHKKIVLAATIAAFLAGCASQQAAEEPNPAASAPASKPVVTAKKPKAKPAPTLMSGADGGMLANTCAGCHGTHGASSGPAAPSIGGLSEDYMIETMNAYKSGERWSTIMGRIATGYSDDEIAAMAKFYAAQPYVGNIQTSEGPLAMAGKQIHDDYCEKCHEDEARSIEDDSGLLAGQWMPYVHWTLEDYISGKNQTNEKGMRKALKKMLEEHGPSSVEKLVNFYGSRK